MDAEKEAKELKTLTFQGDAKVWKYLMIWEFTVLFCLGCLGSTFSKEPWRTVCLIKEGIFCYCPDRAASKYEDRCGGERQPVETALDALHPGRRSV